MTGSDPCTERGAGIVEASVAPLSAVRHPIGSAIRAPRSTPSQLPHP